MAHSMRCCRCNTVRTTAFAEGGGGGSEGRAQGTRRRQVCLAPTRAMLRMAARPIPGPHNPRHKPHRPGTGPTEFSRTSPPVFCALKRGRCSPVCFRCAPTAHYATRPRLHSRASRWLRTGPCGPGGPCRRNGPRSAVSCCVALHRHLVHHQGPALCAGRRRRPSGRIRSLRRVRPHSPFR